MDVFALSEEAAQDRPDTENVELVASGEIAPDSLRAGIRLHLHGGNAVSDKACKDMVAVTQISVVRK